MKERELKMKEACQTSDPCKAYGEKVSGCAGSLTSIGGSHKLNPVAAKKYLEMVDAAKKDGVEWKITDSFRPLKIQCNILDWDHFASTGKKRKIKTAGTPVAFPGNSNHGWGSAVDLGAKYGDKVHTWLTNNAAKFGFSNPFKNPRTEPWHWEHVESAKALKSGLTPMDSGEDVSTSSTSGDTGSSSGSTDSNTGTLTKLLPWEDLAFGAGFSEFAKSVFSKNKEKDGKEDQEKKSDDEEITTTDNLTEELDRIKDLIKKVL